MRMKIFSLEKHEGFDSDYEKNIFLNLILFFVNIILHETFEEKMSIFEFNIDICYKYLFFESQSGMKIILTEYLPFKNEYEEVSL